MCVLEFYTYLFISKHFNVQHSVSCIKQTSCGIRSYVMLCSLIGFNVFKEPALSIFWVECGGCRFLRNIDSCLSSTWHYFPEVGDLKVGESSLIGRRSGVRTLQDVVSSQGLGFRLLMVLPERISWTGDLRYESGVCKIRRRCGFHHLKMCCFEHASWKFKSTFLSGHVKRVTKTKEI
jgi:hypothetical protein